MRALLPALVLLLPLSAAAQPRDIAIDTLRIAQLQEPDWVRRSEGGRVLYRCVNTVRCPLPTTVEIRSAFEAWPAAWRGARLMSTEPAEGGRHGLQIEAATAAGHLVSRSFGEGGSMLDVQVAARSLDVARALADTAIRSLLPQVFDAPALDNARSAR